jgi:hypothetical protein
VAAAEGAAAGLRTALLTGSDPAVSAAGLQAAAQEVERLLAASATDLPTPAAAVTESVSESPQASHREPGTEPVTKKPASAHRRAAQRVVPIDADSVRVERGLEPGNWRVLADDGAGPVEVGYLQSVPSLSGRTRHWRALTAQTLLPVQGGPWKTRQDALVHLVDDHLRRAERGRRR